MFIFPEISIPSTDLFPSELLLTDKAYNLLDLTIRTQSKPSFDLVWQELPFPKMQMSPLLTLFKIKCLGEYGRLVV